MAFGKQVSTYFEGKWHDGDLPIMRAADHGTWLGTSVFDGARTFEGVSPDLDLHCARIVASAEAMGMISPVSPDEVLEIAKEGIARYPKEMPLYIRPMMWSTAGAPGLIALDPESTAFSICIEDMPMPEIESYALGVSDYVRPRADMAITSAKAGSLYANNGRILRDAMSRGFNNALSVDWEGHVAETASQNVFMVRDGEILTPKPNGMFLAGITRKRCIELLRGDGVDVKETSLTLEDFDTADEIFLTANAAKVMPVTRYKDRDLGHGQMGTRMRRLYWDYAHAAG